jgi:hypothetical protein
MGKTKNDYTLINNRMKTGVEMYKQLSRKVAAVQKLNEAIKAQSAEVAAELSPTLGVTSDSELKLSQD